MKLVLPMAGLGTRLRPHTYSKPKPLVSVAGRPVLAHFLDSFGDLSALDEVVFIIGYLGEQIERYIGEQYPQLRARYVWQKELSGQSHAIWLAREGLTGPTLISFVDTLIEADYAALANEQAEAVIWTKEVDDPKRFGVVELDGDRIVRIVEKPEQPPSNLAVVGSYYLAEVERLLEAIGAQMEAGTKLKGEFFIADALNLLLEDGLDMRAETVDVWNDCGTVSALLATNRYLLDHGRDNSAEAVARTGVVVEAPVYLAPDAQVQKAIVGPYASIGSGVTLENSTVADSIVEADARLRDSELAGSLVGRRAHIAGGAGAFNIGDDARVG